MNWVLNFKKLSRHVMDILSLYSFINVFHMLTDILFDRCILRQSEWHPPFPVSEVTVIKPDLWSHIPHILTFSPHPQRGVEVGIFWEWIFLGAFFKQRMQKFIKGFSLKQPGLLSSCLPSTLHLLLQHTDFLQHTKG